MASWTMQARDRLNAYCDRVRDALLDEGRTDADRVIAEVRAQAEAELQGAPQPISVADAERALATLGEPTRWTVARQVPKAPAPRTARLLASTAIALALVAGIAAAVMLL
jgi:hypothetical protein